MKDFLGNKLSINDECVVILNTRTGSSTIRKVFYRAKIVRFTKEKVGFNIVDKYFGLNKERLTYPQDVIKIQDPQIEELEKIKGEEK